MIDALKPYTECKASGQDWLGELPAHWELRRAKYLFREIDERSQTGKEELLSVSHLTGVTPRSQKSVTMFLAESNIGHKVCRPNDLVINTLWAWMAALGVARQTGIVSPAYGVYRPLAVDCFLPRYSDLLLRTPAYAAEYLRRSTGVNSSRLRLYPEQFLQIPLIYPPPDEQAAIVRYLDAQDHRISHLIRDKRRLIELLNEQTQVIIDLVMSHGLNSKISLKPSGIDLLGDIPEHWKIISWRRLILSLKDFGSNGSFAGLRENVKYLDHPDYARLVRLTDLRKGLLNKNGVYISEESYKYLKHSSLHGGEFLIANVGAHAGYVCEMPEIDGPATLGPNMMFAKKINFSLVHPEYLVAVARTSFIQRQLRIIASQSAAQPKLDKDDVRSVLMPLPPLKEQESIVDYLRIMAKRSIGPVTRIEKEIDLLREFRIRLISDVITGKLDVRGVELPAMDEAETIEDINIVDDTEAEELIESEEVADADE